MAQRSEGHLDEAAAPASWWISAATRVAEVVAFALLLFVTRFIARGHLLPHVDQECHIGGIAVELLTHGVRFPLNVYAPNEYDNGSFFSGVLTAVSFTLLGQNALAVKLVTHIISACGAVATLLLLRRCLDEARLSDRRLRAAATAALVITIAAAPRVVTLFSLSAVGNHAEGSALATILLALFVRRPQARSALRTGAFWILVSLALYLNKGITLVLPVLAVAQLVLTWRTPLRLLAAAAGFVIGVLPELVVVLTRHGLGWLTIVSKAEHNAQRFPDAFLNTIAFLGEYRPELLGAWAISVAVGIATYAAQVWRRRAAAAPDDSIEAAPPPIALGVTLGVSCLHLVLLMAMAKDGLDAYVIYGYPTLVVLYALLIARIYRLTIERWGERYGTLTAASLIAATLLVYRPYAASWSSDHVVALWRNHVGSACFWRFAEGFERDYGYHHAQSGKTREQYAVEQCRTFTEAPQVLDCIGGIAREVNWRQRGKAADGEPPPGLTLPERRAYAYIYGTHRKGRLYACDELVNTELAALCLAAAKTECLVWADMYTRLVTGGEIGRPRCDIIEAPFEGYWMAVLADFRQRRGTTAPNLERAWGDDNLDGCKPVYDECYGDR